MVTYMFIDFFDFLPPSVKGLECGDILTTISRNHHRLACDVLLRQRARHVWHSPLQVSHTDKQQSASHLPKHSKQELDIIARKLLAARAQRQLLRDAIMGVGNAWRHGAKSMRWRSRGDACCNTATAYTPSWFIAARNLAGSKPCVLTAWKRVIRLIDVKQRQRICHADVWRHSLFGARMKRLAMMLLVSHLVWALVVVVVEITWLCRCESNEIALKWSWGRVHGNWVAARLLSVVLFRPLNVVRFRAAVASV